MKKSSVSFQITRVCLYAAAAAVFILVPTAFFEAHPLCPIYNMTGYRCPSCGLTRAFSNMFHGNLAAAIGHNPLVLLVFPFYAALTVSDVYSLARRALHRETGNLFEYIFWKVIGKGDG